MTKIKDLHKKWMSDPEYREEYNALEDEFALAAQVAKARSRAGLSQAELARRMKTTQSTIARLESGRGRPSTRTLDRFAKATGASAKNHLRAVEGEKKQSTIEQRMAVSLADNERTRSEALHHPALGAVCPRRIIPRRAAPCRQP